MARLARIVVPGLPHHATQRGNRRMEVFLTPQDREVYLGWLRTALDRHGLELYAYCLMTNHVHLVAVPVSEAALERLLARPVRPRKRGRKPKKAREDGNE